MGPTLEQQLIDNEKHIAQMAATLAAGRIGGRASRDDNEAKAELARWAVSVAQAIQQEVSKEGQKIRAELESQS